MKQVTMHDIQVSFATIINDLPVEVTRFGKVVARIIQPDELYNPEPQVISNAKKPTIEDLKTIPGVTTADKLNTQTETPNEQNKPWGSPKLYCQYCRTSPAMRFVYKDENSDDHEGIFCKTHIDMYQKDHGEKHYDYDTTHIGQAADLTSFNGSFPKPVKKKKP